VTKKDLNRRKKVHIKPKTRAQKQRVSEKKTWRRLVRKTRQFKMVPCEIQFPRRRHAQKLYGQQYNRFGVYDIVKGR